MKAASGGAILLVFLVAATLARPAPATPSSSAKLDRDRGEVLGVDHDKRTFTLRNVTPESKELIVFQVTPETVITDASTGASIPFEDLAPGAKVTVRSRRESGRRLAVTIVVRTRTRKPSG